MAFTLSKYPQTVIFSHHFGMFSQIIFHSSVHLSCPIMFVHLSIYRELYTMSIIPQYVSLVTILNIYTEKIEVLQYIRVNSPKKGLHFKNRSSIRNVI